MAGRARRLLIAGLGAALLGGVVAAAQTTEPPEQEHETIVARGGVGSITVEGAPGTDIYIVEASRSTTASEVWDHPLDHDELLDASATTSSTTPACPSSTTAVSSTSTTVLDEHGTHLPSARWDRSTACPSDLASFDPGLYEVWTGESEEELVHAATVVVRTDASDPAGSQDLWAQSEPWNGSDLTRTGYLATRDGTLLSFFLQLPETCRDGSTTFGVEVEGCDVPTLVEYSLYDPSDPEPESAARDGDVQVGRGYALLSVNARGTGCSGGTFSPSVISRQEGLDGYDAIEVLAAQPWSNHRVGMTGTSYPGVSQVNVASTRPPHLAAITASAVIGEPYGNAYPGGIATGYFDFWWDYVVWSTSAPAPTGVQNWVSERIVGGDHTCATNTATRAHNVDFTDQVARNPLHSAVDDVWAMGSIRDRLARVAVPTLIAEGLGDPLALEGFDALFDPHPSRGGTPAVLDRTSPEDGPPIRILTGSGGHHLIGSPEGQTEQDTFLDLYVADRLPAATGPTKTRPSTTEAPCRPSYLEGTGAPTTVAGAKAALEAADPIVLYWDQQWDEDTSQVAVGALDVTNCHAARARSTSRTWPLSPTGAVYSFHDDGSMSDTAPTSTTATEAYDDVARAYAPLTAQTPPVLPPADRSATFTTGELAEATTFAGPASVDLWLTSDEPVVDLEVTLTDVGPGGAESVVQHGWRRSCVASHSSDTDPLQPRLALTVAATGPECAAGTCATSSTLCLDASTPKLVRVPISSFAHIFRAGHRVRVRVSAPGYTHLGHRFPGTIRRSTTNVVDVHTNATHSSQLVLPAATAPAPLVGPGDITNDLASAPSCGVIEGMTCFAPVIQTVVATPTGVDGGVHVDWDTLTQPPWVAGYEVYRDDEEEPVATVPSVGRPGQYTGVLTDVPDDSASHTFSVLAVSSIDENRRVLERQARRSQPSNEVNYDDTLGPAGSNLIVTGASTNEGSTPHWTDLSGGQVSLTTTAHGGSQGIEWKQGASGFFPAMTPGTSENDLFAVEAGDTYHAEVWVHGAGSADTKVGLAIVWWAEGDVALTSVQSVDVAAASGWTKVELTATAPPGATIATPAMLITDRAVHDEPETEHIVVVDDLTFCEGRHCT
jgi:predicted acyl esterase